MTHESLNKHRECRLFQALRIQDLSPSLLVLTDAESLCLFARQFQESQQKPVESCGALSKHNQPTQNMGGKTNRRGGVSIPIENTRTFIEKRFIRFIFIGKEGRGRGQCFSGSYQNYQDMAGVSNQLGVGRTRDQRLYRGPGFLAVDALAPHPHPLPSLSVCKFLSLSDFLCVELADRRGGGD